MVNVSIARRYARALLEASGAQADAVLKSLELFVQALQSSSELTDVVQNPAYTRAQKTAVLESMLKTQADMPVALANTLRLLVDRSRMQFLPDVARLYRDMVDVKVGRVRGRITSAKPLSADQLKQLETTLETITQRDVVIEATVDPKVLGGVSAQVGSVVYDGTLKTHINLLGRSLRA